MKKTRFTDEQMVTILRVADRRPVPEVAKQHGGSAQTIWRKHVGTLEPADVRRLRQLEQENGRLKKMGAGCPAAAPAAALPVRRVVERPVVGQIADRRRPALSEP